jgi:hypothetical protein
MAWICISDEKSNKRARNFGWETSWKTANLKIEHMGS